jgi:hypothetical protein
MIEAKRAQFLKYVIGTMVDGNMSPTPPKVIGRDVYLRTQGHLGYQRILDPKGVQTFYGGRNQRK